MLNMSRRRFGWEMELELKEKMSMRMIPAVVLGCGGVGRQLLHHIVHSRSLRLRLRLRLLVVGIADSRSFITPPHLLLDPTRSDPPPTPSTIPSFSDDFLLHLCRLNSTPSSLPPDLLAQCHLFPAPDSPNQIIRLASLLATTTGLVLVDCSATSDTITILQHGLHLGCCVVLANKKPLTSKMDDYEKLVSHPRHIRYESTVGAGLPVITSLARFISSGDSIFRIVGSFSGTLGYVMSELETEKPLSQVVRAAKNLGYTEPDPRDDLGGMDVARKALILARLLGWKIDLEDIKVDCLYPDAMKPDKMTIKDFMEKGLPLLDKDMEEKVQIAFSTGKVLRYVCIIEDSRCQVGLLELPRDSPLGRLQGSDNIVEVYSRCYEEQPMVIQGAGAGNDTTAAGVLADIIDLQDLFPS